MSKKSVAPSKKQGGTRSASRLAAVQALYQMEMNDEFAAQTVAEFVDHRLGEIIEDDHYTDADKFFFADLVKGVEKQQTEIDNYVAGSLSADWTLARIETVARAILRAGTYELMSRIDVPTSVVINEYVDVAKAFFDDKMPGFINGVLDKLSKEIRQ